MRISIFLVFIFFVFQNAYAYDLDLIVIDGSLAVKKGGKNAKELSAGEFFIVNFDESPETKIQIMEPSIFSITEPNRHSVLIDLPSKEIIGRDEVMKRLSPSSYGQAVLALKKLFFYESSSAQGGKRLDDQETLPELPGGILLMPHDELVINLREQGDSQYRDFKLIAAGEQKTVFQLAHIDQAILIPAAALSFGEDYDWTMTKNGQQYRGTFAIAFQEDQQAFEDELMSIPNYEQLSPQGKLLIKAVKAKEWQYLFDMDAAARQLIDFREGQK